MTNALRNTKNLVKLDLSNNGLKPKVVAFLLDALMTNNTVTDLNLHGNMLDDEFAVDLSHCLEENDVLYRVVISQNPIGRDGAQHILKVLLEYNSTLGSLGDLTHNVMMGVSVRKDIDEALRLNNTTGQARKRILNQASKGRQKNFPESSTIERGIEEVEPQQVATQ